MKPHTPGALSAMSIAVALAALAVPFERSVAAHHSFAMYDQTKTVTLTGVVRQFVAQANHAEWGPLLRRAVMAELQRAEAEQLRFIEAGGWALAPELRFTTEALQLALGSYAIGELLGGSLGVTTATVRHRSSST